MTITWNTRHAYVLIRISSLQRLNFNGHFQNTLFRTYRLSIRLIDSTLTLVVINPTIFAVMYRKQLLITKTIIKPQPTDSQIDEY